MTSGGNAVAGHAWQWPSVGAAPVHYGLDSEIFDTERFPHIQTFVREAIQNSLDARFDKTKPVCVRFTFHKTDTGGSLRFYRTLKPRRRFAVCAGPMNGVQGRRTG